jgi:mannose-1-phosphate guanylyltransferase
MPDDLSGFVLAAGRGTRLAPLTDHLPKPALPLLSLPLVAFALLHLHRAGVRSAAINAHHLAERLQLSTDAWRIQHLHRMELRWSLEEEQLLGTGGGLSRARALGLISDRAPVLVVNSDVLCDVDARALVEAHRSSGADATLVVKEHADAERFGAVRADAEGALVDLAGLWNRPGGRTAVSGVFTGISVLGPALWEHLPGPDEVSCVVRQGLLPLVRAGGDIRVRVHPGRWQDLGTPARFLEGQRSLFAGDWPLPTSQVERALFGLAAYAVDGQGRRHGDRSALPPDLEIEGPVFVGTGCRLGPGVRLGPNAVVGPGASIGGGATVQDALVLARSEVEEGETLRAALVGSFGGGRVRVDAAEAD